jgi:protein-tyrosine phosphatase
MSKPIRLTCLPNVYLFALKTPLPAAHQVLFPSPQRWTIEKAVAMACTDLHQQPFDVVVTSVETNGPFDFMDNADCVASHVLHYYQEIDQEYSPDRIDKFCDLLRTLPSPGRTQVVLVSSHNGINRPGFLIAGALMCADGMSARAAVKRFSLAHTGIWALPAINQLNQLRRGEPALSGKPWPEALPPPERTWQPPIKQEAIHLLHLYGGRLLHPKPEAPAITRVKAYLLSLKRAELRMVQGDLFPEMSVWKPELLELISMHRFRATYTPRGTTVYVVILEPDCLHLCIPSGNNTWNALPDPHHQFFRFAATVKGTLPVICMGVLTEIEARPVVILTDILKMGTDELSGCDLEDRLSRIRFDVIGNISKCPLEFRFRAVGDISQRMIEMEASLKSTLGFSSDGLTLLAHAAPARMSLFIPIEPTVKLRVHFNTKRHAIFFARAEDGSGLFPITIWRAKNEADRLMDGKTVRFEVHLVEREIAFRPISFTSADTHDFVRDVKAILEFVMGRYDPKLVVAECESVIQEVLGSPAQNGPEYLS